MKYLGPLSSALSGSRLFYVDISPQLDTTETLSVLYTCSTTDSDINISSTGILTSGITTKDGHALPADQTVYFRAGCAVSKTVVSPITLEYGTSLGNMDSTIVYLKVVPNII